MTTTPRRRALALHFMFIAAFVLAICLGSFASIARLIPYGCQSARKIDPPCCLTRECYPTTMGLGVGCRRGGRSPTDGSPPRSALAAMERVADIVWYRCSPEEWASGACGRVEPGN